MLESKTQKLFLHENKSETDEAKPNDYRACDDHLERERDEDQAEGGQKTAFEQEPKSGRPRAKQWSIVEALSFEDEWRGRDEDEIKPNVITEFVDGREIKEIDDVLIRAQHVGEPETGCE